jgi:hypothetical protein
MSSILCRNDTHSHLDAASLRFGVSTDSAELRFFTKEVTVVSLSIFRGDGGGYVADDWLHSLRHPTEADFIRRPSHNI